MSVRWPRGQEVMVERARQEAKGRTAAMVEELRKAELVRDRLEGLEQLARSYPEGHHTRVLLENLHLERALEAVEEDIRTLRDALLHPGGT
jgi:hypothetical protein